MHYKFDHPEWFDGIERPDFPKYSSNLIIYGAGFQGALAVHLLEKMGVKVICFLDKDKAKQGTLYQGYPVLEPVEGRRKNPTAAVIVTAFPHDSAFSFARDELCFENVFTPFSLLLEFDYDGFNEREQLPEWYLKELSNDQESVSYHLGKYLRKLANSYLVESDTSVFKHGIYLRITEKCNLRCKDCVAYAPYIKEPRHFDIELIKKMMAVFCKDRQISTVVIGGGETFLYPDMEELLFSLLQYPQIDELLLTTNGTIIPDENVMQAMQDPRVKVSFSYYGEHSTLLQEFADECEERGIRYVIQSQEWKKFSTIPANPITEEEFKEVTDACCKLNQSNNLLLSDGKIYYCPMSSQSERIDLVPANPEDYIDLMSYDDDIQEKIDDFIFNRKPVAACWYCYGRGYTNESVVVADQWPEGVTPAIERV